jgi:hypothetical protein
VKRAVAPVVAALLASACASDDRGPVAGPERWRARPAGRIVAGLVATGDGAVLAETSEGMTSWIERVDETGSVWSVTTTETARRAPFAATADGGAILVAHDAYVMSGQATVDFHLRRFEADGTRRWDRVVARATTLDAAAVAVVSAPDGFYLILRVKDNATLEIGGTVMRGEDMACRDQAVVCGFTVLAHVDQDGALQAAGEIRMVRFEIVNVALVAGQLVIGGWSDIVAIRVPPGDEQALSPSWTIDFAPGTAGGLVAADAARHVYAVRWSLSPDDDQPRLVRIDADGVEEWAQPVADTIDAVVAGPDNVTALVSHDLEGIATSWFLVSVDGSGQIVAREPIDGSNHVVLAGDTAGRFFYVEIDEIVARDPLP